MTGSCEIDDITQESRQPFGGPKRLTAQDQLELIRNSRIARRNLDGVPGGTPWVAALDVHIGQVPFE